MSQLEILSHVHRKCITQVLPNFFSNLKIVKTGQAAVLDTPSTLKNQTVFSVVSPCILALFPVTTNRLPGTSLRWATGSNDK